MMGVRLERNFERAKCKLETYEFILKPEVTKAYYVGETLKDWVFGLKATVVEVVRIDFVAI